MVLALSASTCKEQQADNQTDNNTSTVEVPTTETHDPNAPTVYFTSDISAAGLVKIYESLGVTPSEGQRVAVKISTGESSQSNHQRPELIKDLVKKVNGTLVECNTAYGGNRMSTANHRKAIAERGYNEIATVDIMDEEGSKQIPVQDTKHIKYDIVGTHIDNYDFMINLAHFKGHAMGGFGGVLKNQIIGVMNNMSVDCDCDGSPASPKLRTSVSLPPSILSLWTRHAWTWCSIIPIPRAMTPLTSRSVSTASTVLG